MTRQKPGNAVPSCPVTRTTRQYSSLHNTSPPGALHNSQLFSLIIGKAYITHRLKVLAVVVLLAYFYSSTRSMLPALARRT
jgi:hypothetical protein